MKVRKTMLKGKNKEVEEVLFLWREYLKRKRCTCNWANIAGKSFGI
jgi:hypothetical protein